MVDLELQGRLPADADMNETWEQAIKTIEWAQKASVK
jgi:hypothetical protein